MSLITAWLKVTTSPIKHLLTRFKNAGYQGLDEYNLVDSNAVVILDEAQSSYHDLELWLGLIKSQSGVTAGLRLCLFSSYGSPTNGRVDYPLGTTPVHFGPAQRISIMPSPSAPDNPHLFYTRSEFDDAINRQLSNPNEPLTLDKDAAEYLFEVTNGHPAAVHALTRFIFEVCERNCLYLACPLMSTLGCGRL